MATRPETQIPFPIVCWDSLQHLQLHLGGTPIHYLFPSSILLEHDFKHSCHLMTPWFAHLPLLQFHMLTFHILEHAKNSGVDSIFFWYVHIMNHCTFSSQIALICTWQGWPEGHSSYYSLPAAVYFFQASLLFSIKNAKFSSIFGSFFCEFTHFLVYFYGPK